MLEKAYNAESKNWPRASALGLCLLLLLVLTATVYAESGFEVESATIYESASNYYLNASIDYEMQSEAYAILAKGLPIRISFELEIYNPRRYWFDRTLLEKEFSYRLQHDPITDQYELTRNDTDFTLSYATAEQAVDSLHYLSNLFLVETHKISAGKQTQVQMRMSLDVRNFPDPLQYLSQYWGDWVRTTSWYRWTLLSVEGSSAADLSAAEDSVVELSSDTASLENLDPDQTGTEVSEAEQELEIQDREDRQKN